MHFSLFIVTVCDNFVELCILILLVYFILFELYVNGSVYPSFLEFQRC